MYSRAGNLAAESRFVRTLCLAVSIVLHRCRSDTATVVRKNGTMRLFGVRVGVIVMLADGHKGLRYYRAGMKRL